MTPMPKVPTVFPKGTILINGRKRQYTLLTAATWDGGNLGTCQVFYAPDERIYEQAAGNWPTGYISPDYPLREADRSATLVLWETVLEGVYYQCIAPASEPADLVAGTNACIINWRGKLGRVGSAWRTSEDDDWNYSSNYVPKDETVVAVAPPPAAAEPVVVPDAPAREVWPSRADRVARLTMELDMSPAERLRVRL